MSKKEKYGLIPDLDWININCLIIDATYQRDTLSQRSQRNIEKIKQNFSWAKFSPLTVADQGNNTFSIIDGQHRYIAAKELGDIESLPCWIIPECSTKSQADAFIDINKNRVYVNNWQMYKAKLAAKDAFATRIEEFLNGLNVSIPFNGYCSKPNMTLAIACIGKHLQQHNDAYLAEVINDILKAYPMPKPIYCTLTNDSLIPVPDYVEIKTLLDELDGVNSRMRLTMQALKVTGCYDNSFPELANILDKDVSLLSVSDFTKLKEKGGLSGIVDFMPIGQYIEALQGLSERRAQLTQTIYEITGVSDIMRGSSDPKETATAVQKKTNFGTLRNQDRQNDMQRFITDLLKIKAEMICEMFREETLIRFADEDADDATKKQAIMLLRENKTRDLCIGIETETGFQQDNTQEKTLEAVKIINELVARSFEFVSAQPSLLPLYKQLTQSVVSTLPNTRQFEPVIDEVFNKIGIELAQPDQPDEQNQEDILKAQNEMAKTKLQAQKNANDLAIKQEQNAIKRNEIMLKNQVDNRKLDYTKEEMDRQFTLKEMDLAIDGSTDANITTGLVGAP